VKSMKLRFILMGCILSVMGVGLIAGRGFSDVLAGVLVVGIALLVLGLLYR